MSVIYFMEHGDKLPAEAVKVAAANLVEACRRFDLRPPVPLMKAAAIPMGFRRGALTGGVAGAALGGIGGAIGAPEGKRMKGGLIGAGTGGLIGASMGGIAGHHTLKTLEGITPEQIMAEARRVAPPEFMNDPDFYQSFMDAARKGMEMNKKLAPPIAGGMGGGVTGAVAGGFAGSRLSPANLPEKNATGTIGGGGAVGFGETESQKEAAMKKTAITMQTPAMKSLLGRTAENAPGRLTNFLNKTNTMQQRATAAGRPAHAARLNKVYDAAEDASLSSSHNMNSLLAEQEAASAGMPSAMAGSMFVKGGSANVVDITGKRPAPKIKVAAPTHARDYAVVIDGKGYYPIHTWDMVKKAEVYYQEERKRMQPAIRREYATKLAQKAAAMGYPLDPNIFEAGSLGWASSGHLKSAVEMRKIACAPKSEGRAFLTELFEKRASMTPSTYAECLRRFDVQTGLDKGWDISILDPWASTYGLNKTAQVVWEDGADRVTSEELQQLATGHAKRLCGVLTDDMKKEFMKDPVGIFESMPLPEKRLLARLASDHPEYSTVSQDVAE